MKIHHFGYAVNNIELAIKSFQALGYKKSSELTKDQIRNVEILFIEKDGLKLELISPLSENSPVATILKKLGPTIYHICYETEDLEKEIDVLQKEKFFVVQGALEALAIDNLKVAFLFNKEIGLLEIVEAKGKNGE